MVFWVVCSFLVLYLFLFFFGKLCFGNILGYIILLVKLKVDLDIKIFCLLLNNCCER